MGAGEFTELEAPPQPSAKLVVNPFAEAAYARVTGVGGRSNGNSGDAMSSSFSIYDEDALDDGGAETGQWESEATGIRREAKPWQPRYYQQYFDIKASDLAARLMRSLLPVKPLLESETLQEESESGTSMPDLYGPVWVTTTLVLALSMGSGIAEFLRNVFQRREVIASAITASQFRRLWRAGGILYAYVFLFPILLAVFQCFYAKRALDSSTVQAHPIMGSIMVYGYSMTPVVVAAMVATIPLQLVQVISIGAAFAIGACTIVLNLWRDLPDEHRNATYTVRAVAALAHAAVGAALVFTFYWHP